MKKYLKIMACAMMVLAMAGMMSSCKKEYKQQVVYSAGWADYKFISYAAAQDMKTVKDYLVEKGALNVGQYKIYDVTSKNSEEDCLKQADEMAKADFANAVRNLKVEEIQPRIAAGSYFTYAWSRTNDGGGKVEIGRWECPSVQIPSELGKITINGTECSVTNASLSGTTIGEFSASKMSLRAGDVRFYLTIGGPEYSMLNPIVPIGEFAINNNNAKCQFVFNGIKYNAGEMSCTISKNGAFYRIVTSEGTAVADDGSEISFKVNCDYVAFNID